MGPLVGVGLIALRVNKPYSTINQVSSEGVRPTDVQPVIQPCYYEL